MKIITLGMSIIALGLCMVANKVVNTRFRRFALNEAFAKLLIIVGACPWYDIPHLHHPLIHLRQDIEWRLWRK